jgi:hypothetical protein
MRARLALLALLVLTTTALAHPPPPPDPEPSPPRRARLEWSSWLRVAYGSAPAPTTAAARVVGPVAPSADRDHGWEVALGADATVGIGADGDLRLGPWVELRTSSDAMIGGELQVTGLPRKLDLFWYEGRGVLALRAGGNRDLATAAVAYGTELQGARRRAPLDPGEAGIEPPPATRDSRRVDRCSFERTDKLCADRDHVPRSAGR